MISWSQPIIPKPTKMGLALASKHSVLGNPGHSTAKKGFKPSHFMELWGQHCYGYGWGGFGAWKSAQNTRHRVTELYIIYITIYIYIFHCLDYAGVQSNVMSCKRMDSSKASSKPLTSICNKPLATTPKTGLHDPASWRGERVRETT